MSSGWNLLLYAIAGSEGERQDVRRIIEDMRESLTTDHCNIAVQVMAPARTTRYWIAAGRMRKEVLTDVVDASQPRGLTGFIDAASETLPAAATALVLRAHATGLDNIHDYPRKHGDGLGGTVADEAGSVEQAVLRHLAIAARIEEPVAPEAYGCRWGPDPNSHRFLTNVAMKKAIAASRAGAVRLLGLNACWMATLEIEYELRAVTDVVVASQVYARPWPYRAIAEAMSAHPEQSCEQLARAIVASVRAGIERGPRKDAVSAFRAGAAMAALAAAFDRYAERVTALIDGDWEAVRDAVMTRAQRIDDPHQVDLVSLTQVLGDHDGPARAAGEAVRRQFHAMRLGNVAHAAHPGVHGMSIFCPKSLRVDLGDAYKGTEFRSNRWAGFLVKFQRRLARS